MRRFRSRQLVVLAVAALVTWSCSTTTPTTPSAVTPGVIPPTVTEAFTSQLTPNGSVTFTFSTNTNGLIVVTLASISPDSSLTLGLGLGVLNGTTCEIKIKNDTSLQSTVVTGTAGSASSFCATVYDAAGVVTSSETISLTVTHF